MIVLKVGQRDDRRSQAVSGIQGLGPAVAWADAQRIGKSRARIVAAFECPAETDHGQDGERTSCRRIGDATAYRSDIERRTIVQGKSRLVGAYHAVVPSDSVINIMLAWKRMASACRRSSVES